VDGAKRRLHAGFDAGKMPVPRRLACPVFEMHPVASGVIAEDSYGEAVAIFHNYPHRAVNGSLALKVSKNLISLTGKWHGTAIAAKKEIPSIMTKYITQLCGLLLFLAVRLDAGVTAIPEIIQLGGFSVAYKIDDPYSWSVRVADDKSSVSYKYATSTDTRGEGMAEFTISSVRISAKLRGGSASDVADEIIRQDAERALRKTYESRIVLRLNKEEKLESSAGDVILYTSDKFFIRQSANALKRHSNFHAYAALVLPDDYASRGIAYMVTGVEMNDSRMERPIQMEKFRAFVAGLKEDAGARDAVAPAADIIREPVFTGKYYNVNEVDSPPRQRGRPREAVYPAGLRDKGITGAAVIGFIVDTDGRAQQVQIGYATHREFGESAAKAVEKWRYDPAKKGGETVACTMFVPIAFELGGGVVPAKKTSGKGKQASGKAVRREPVFKSQYYGASEVDTLPETIKRDKFPTPRNPSSLIRRGITRGDVVIAFIVNAKGAPIEVQIEESNADEYANDAVAAVKTWQFKPATKGGVPVNCRVQAPFSFDLESTVVD
jgi:TonB family protein